MPENAEDRHGPVASAFSTSVSSNATAFGFSITITISFGALQTMEGTPKLLDLLLYGLAAAVAIGLLESAVTRGFRERVGTLPPEVAMLGTAMNFLSVAAGAGAAMLAGELLDGVAAWLVAGFAAATVYVISESAEVLVAEKIQKARGNVDAEDERDES